MNTTRDSRRAELLDRLRTQVTLHDLGNDLVEMRSVESGDCIAILDRRSPTDKETIDELEKAPSSNA